jgi:hypothetical protein
VWRVSEDPTVELGVVEGDPSQQFNRVAGAARLSDGRVVVADGGSKELRFFDPSGNHLHTVGGQGEGPGEFAYLAALDRLPGDTIVASDWPIGTLSWFDSDGRYLDKSRLGPYRPGLTGRVLPDGSLLVDVYERGSYGNELEWWAATGQTDTFRPAGMLVRVSRSGDRVDTLRGIVGEEWFKIGKVRQGLVMRPLPFARNTFVTWSENYIYVGETGQRQIEVLTLEGSLERLIRWKSHPSPVTRADRGSVRETIFGSMRRTSQKPDFERWLAAVPFPTIKTAFRDLDADAAGRIWVQNWMETEGGRDRWIVFEADGVLLAEVDVPQGLQLLEIGEDYVLALRTDALDLEYVGLYQLEK